MVKVGQQYGSNNIKFRRNILFRKVTIIFSKYGTVRERKKRTCIILNWI